MAIENISRGVHTCPDDVETDTQSADAVESTPLSPINSSKDDETDQSGPKMIMPFSSVSRGRFHEDSTYTSGTEVYKMVTRSEKGKRAPAHIEFNLYRKPEKRPSKAAFSIFTTSSAKKSKSTNDIQSQANSRLLKNTRSRASVQFKETNDQKSDMKCKEKQSGVSIPSSHNQALGQTKSNDENATNIDFYWFDRGEFQYLCTTDEPPHLNSEVMARRTIACATKFWAEVYGSIHIAVAFTVAFPMQTYRFCLYSIFRPISIGFLQLTSDYAIKPFLTAVFNGLVQPPLRMVHNIFSTIHDMVEPIARIFGLFLQPITNLCQSFRLVEVHYHSHYAASREGEPIQSRDAQTDCMVEDFV